MIEGKNSCKCGCPPGTDFLVKGVLTLENQVRVCCSKFNPVVSRNSIAKKVKDIREKLEGISTDMSSSVLLHVNSMKATEYTTRCSADDKCVIGRDEDKKIIMKMLFNESPAVIAIDGIGGMGKTTLTHLIYKDESVGKIFEKRWFACISNIFDDKEILGKIYQSITEQGYNNLGTTQLEDKIKEYTTGKKYLLILDDVWDEHRGKWEKRKGVLSNGAKGSKIIVTTRLPSVVSAVGAVRTHSLRGLSDEDSWSLFRSLAFDSNDESDGIKESLGRELVKRCRGVPLAIWSMGSFLYKKTLQQWQDFKKEGAPKLGAEEVDETMSTLRLSYDHLPPNLKQCFTYCSLFPKGYRYNKDELINHWVAQGYLEPLKEESGFMRFLDTGIFQEEQKDSFGLIQSCKMHDLLHDLASYLADEEIIMMRSTSRNTSDNTRFVSLMADDEESAPWDIVESLLSVKSMRSCLLSWLSSTHIQPDLNQLCSNFNFLRTLTLSGLGIEDIPPSIKELKLVRYLDLSYNNFEKLPDSITNLVNLLILNLESCSKLKEWPPSFKKLVKLRSLNLKYCDELNLMPEGIKEIPGLQYLSDFIVGTDSELDVLSELLKKLRGDLSIRFCGGLDERTLEIPAVVSLKHLDMSHYPGRTIRFCGINECSSELVRLLLSSCENIKHLPPSSCFPNLRWLHLLDLSELKTLQEEELSNGSFQRPFFPCLEELILYNMPKLSRLQGKASAEATPSASSVSEFSRLSKLRIVDCPKLELSSFPTCTRLRELHLENVDNNTPEVIEHETLSTVFCSSSCPAIEKIAIYNCKRLSGIPGEALASLREVDIRFCCSLKSLHLASPHLIDIEIEECDELMSIEVVEEPSPLFLKIRDCKQLTSLNVSLTEKMEITNCPELRLLPKVESQSD